MAYDVPLRSVDCISGSRISCSEDTFQSITHVRGDKRSNECSHVNAMKPCGHVPVNRVGWLCQ